MPCELLGLDGLSVLHAVKSNIGVMPLIKVVVLVFNRREQMSGIMFQFLFFHLLYRAGKNGKNLNVFDYISCTAQKFVIILSYFFLPSIFLGCIFFFSF